MGQKTRVIRWFAILKRLWAATRDRPEVRVRIEDIAIHGEYFWSKGESQGFGIREILADPVKHAYGFSLICDEDENLPIMLRTNNVPVDGIYRVAKAILEKKTVMKAVYVTQSEIEAIAPGFDSARFHPQHVCRECGINLVPEQILCPDCEYW